jgi:hypothetical protein
MNNEGTDKPYETEGWFIVFPAGGDVALEIDGDGARWFGPEGQTRIVFTADGNVGLRMQGETAEHRALRKNFDQEVTAGDVTLTFRDFSYPHKGVPSYSENLATLVHSVVHEVNDEKAAVKIFKQLKSVLHAAHRRAHEDLGCNDHARFRDYVQDLAKRLGRPPCRSEIRKAFYPGCDARGITKLCDANGFGWLPRGEEGRPPIEKVS